MARLCPWRNVLSPADCRTDVRRRREGLSCFPFEYGTGLRRHVRTVLSIIRAEAGIPTAEDSAESHRRC